MRVAFAAMTILLHVLPVFAEKGPQPLADVLKRTPFRKRLLVQGTLTKQMDLDVFVLSDATAAFLANFQDVKDDLKVGDQVVVYGRYQGRVSHSLARAQIDALIFARLSDTAAADELIKKYGVDLVPAPSATPSPLPGSDSPPSSKNVETRLKELEDLKAKNLVTDEEYKEQRKRILGSL